MSLGSDITPFFGAAGAGGTGYEISRSLRFNSADSAYLSRTPASAGNRKTWTWAGWVKRSALGARQNIFGTGDASFNNANWIEFFSDDKLRIADYTTSIQYELRTTQLFRDTSGWGHLVVTVDTAQTTSSNRVKAYWNGTQITSFSTATYPSLNLDTQLNTTNAHGIGRAGSYNGLYLSGYLAEIHFIDGLALDPTSFGGFDTNGIWQPIEYTGAYGTNGFHLDFSDNSSAAALGTDTSGNGNTWTVNNLSVAAGAGNDSLVDVPTNGTQADTGVGGEVRGNYCTWNPLKTLATLSNGNLDGSGGGAGYYNIAGTFGVTSGKWYWEVTMNTLNQAAIGVATPEASLYENYVSPTSVWVYYSDGTKRGNGANNAYGASYGANVIGVALDMDAGTLVFYKNGVSQGTAFSTGLSGKTIVPWHGMYFSTSSSNFGQRPFAYTAPSGFKALCTANLPAPTIEDGSTAMDVVTYTGTGSALTPTSTLGFNPDLIWIKSRSAATDHALYDSVRGAQARLESNTTGAEVTSDSGVTAFNTAGFTLGTLAQVNTNAATYAAWTWDAGSSTVTNNDGSISSQVRANASAGFSIVSYTGNGTVGATVGHGLGVTPGMVILRSRDTVDNWVIWHRSLSPNGYYLLFTTAAQNNNILVFNQTDPTSSVITFNNFTSTNGSGQGYIAYCFAPVAGYSAFGSYTGNGSTDGPFVFCNFRPALVLVKMSSSTGNWTMLDYKREGYNVDNDPLYPNLANAEGTTDLIDITSNGFKVRTTDATFNTNGGTYVYAAWAESPFALNARAR